VRRLDRRRFDTGFEGSASAFAFDNQSLEVSFYEGPKGEDITNSIEFDVVTTVIPISEQHDSLSHRDRQY
jgi:hypothetical protein